MIADINVCKCVWKKGNSSSTTSNSHSHSSRVGWLRIASNIHCTRLYRLQLADWECLSLLAHVFVCFCNYVFVVVKCIECSFFSNCALNRTARAFTLYDRPCMCKCININFILHIHTHACVSAHIHTLPRIHLTNNTRTISMSVSVCVRASSMAEGEPNSGNLSNLWAHYYEQFAVECDSWVRRRLLIGKRLKNFCCFGEFSILLWVCSVIVAAAVFCIILVVDQKQQITKKTKLHKTRT